MSVLYHLPAIVIRDEAEDHHRMVAACGKRGPIRAREAGIGAQLDLLPGRICPECEVRWDAAEHAGAMAVRWLTNGKREWAALGAVLWKVRPEPYRCTGCGRLALPGNFNPDCLAVVVREVRSPVVRSAA